jgi:hypothetical protein
MNRNLPTVSSENNIKIVDYKIPSSIIKLSSNEADSSPDVINPLYIIPEINQLSGDLFPKTVPISPDFYQLIDDKMIVDDGPAGSYELLGGGINYKEKYLKYKNKYLSLKRDIYTQGDSFKQKYIQLKTEYAFVPGDSFKNKYLSLAKREKDIYTQGDNIKQKYLKLNPQLGGTLPIKEQNIYTNIYYSNNGDLNKIKEFFLETNNKHYVKEIINYINKIDTYIFNNFKKEEKIIFWIAMNDEYIDSKNKEDNTRLHKIKNVAYQFKRLYDDWRTYPKKEIENLEIIKDLSYYFDSI